MATDQSEIKRYVQERYGARARNVIEVSDASGCGEGEDGDSGCCGPSDFDRALRLYNEAQVSTCPPRPSPPPPAAATPPPWPV